MTNVNRSLPTTTKTLFGATKRRLHAVTAVTALAFVAGLSGPAVSAFAAQPATPAHTTAAAAHSSVHAATPTQATTAAANAIAAKITGTNPAAPKPAAPKTWADIAPSANDLFTQGKATGQSSFGLDADQLRNARTIVQTGQKLGLQPRAWVIALSTAMQESKLRNLGNLGAANDHDSLGLFQQRPASGWGTPAEINNPVYAATAFYKTLEGVSGWQSMSVTDAAQAVQVSAFGGAYAQWEQQAGDIISGLYGYGPYAAQAKALR
ncbi:MAG: hypothetical protein ACM3JP_02460 [Betaproteobacteria bacterium]